MRVQDVMPRQNDAVSSSFDVFDAQRTLRTQLLDRPTVRYRPARDLAAHMLLNLDDLTACWAIATDWLRVELDCQRVDTGFGAAEREDYFPSFAEAKDEDCDVPSFGGSAVNNRDPLMQAMWRGTRPVVLADIQQDRRVTAGMRRRMSGARTKSKFGAALRTREGSFGLICADWTEHLAPNESGLFDCFEQTVADVLSPIIAVARQIEIRPGDEREPEAHRHAAVLVAQRKAVRIDVLTESEAEVAQLVAQGLSYKSIARIRGRAFSTIDHQLRSIRQKLGVTSTAELISLLATQDAGHDA